MATDLGTDRHALSRDAERDGLLRRLASSGSRYEFVQAMRLLELVFQDAAPPGEAGPLSAERIRMHSNPELVFPAGDVHSIAPVDADGRWDVALQFMGLSGVSSPLPAYFVELVVKQLEGGASMRDFLAMFEHRTYSLFWRAWKKYRLDLGMDRVGEGRRARFLVGVAGFALPELEGLRGIDPLRLAGFAGLIGVARPSCAGLRNLVSGWFGGIPVRVHEFVPRRVFVWQRAVLGGDGGMGSARLGDNALIGDTVLDRASMVRVAIGPLPLSQYRALLPGGTWAFGLAHLLRLYLRPEHEFQIQLGLKHEEVPPCRLGDADARLGWLSWLGKPVGDGESSPMSAAAFAAAA